MCLASSELHLTHALFSGTLKCWQAEKPVLRAASGEAPAGAVPVATLNGHTSRVTAIEAAPGGHIVVSTSADFTARLWRRCEPFTCIAICRATPSDGVLTSLSVGQTTFVTGSESGGILVWPLRSAAQAAGGAASRRALGLAPDGVTARSDRVILSGLETASGSGTVAPSVPEVLGLGPPQSRANASSLSRGAPSYMRLASDATAHSVDLHQDSADQLAGSQAPLLQK